MLATTTVTPSGPSHPDKSRPCSVHLLATYLLCCHAQTQMNEGESNCILPVTPTTAADSALSSLRTIRTWSSHDMQASLKSFDAWSVILLGDPVQDGFRCFEVAEDAATGPCHSFPGETWSPGGFQCFVLSAVLNEHLRWGICPLLILSHKATPRYARAGGGRRGDSSVTALAPFLARD